jgi:hypothetical protein
VNPPPPLPWLLAYRLLNLRVPEQYRAWVAEDLKGRSFLLWNMLRTTLWVLAGIGLFAVGQQARGSWPTRKSVVFLVIVAIVWGLLSSRKTLVRKTLRWQRIDKRGNPRPPKQLGLLENPEAVALGLVALMLLVSASVLWGNQHRPKPVVKFIPCNQPAPATLDRIKAGITHPDTKLLAAESLTSGTGEEVVALLLQENKAVAGEKRPKSQIELIFVQGARITAYKFPSVAGWTRFPAAERTDRIADEITRRVFTCLGRAGSR